MPDQVSYPLTLVMNIKSPADFEDLQRLLSDETIRNSINNALTEVGTVHFARFVFLSQDQLAVITSYDGDFEVYIRAFTHFLGDIFDKLLSHMSDAPPLPVKDNIEKFFDYIKANDRSYDQATGQRQPIYSAYPTLTVQDILGMAGEGQETS